MKAILKIQQMLLKMMLYLVTHTLNSPDEAGYVTVSFKEGVPVAVDGQEGTPLQLLEKLNEIVAHYGVRRCRYCRK